MSQKQTYSLSQICDAISQTLSYALPSTFWVRAEISSISVRGHCYMELVEKAQSAGMLAAKVRATCWQSTWNMLSAYFVQQTSQTMQVGMNVLVEAEVSFHAVYGLSLNIVGIDPAYTLGDLARQREQTIQRLHSDGVWDMQSELPLPTLLQRIAVISSADAAGYGDFTHQLQKDNYNITTTLFPAIMQGDSAARSIIAALCKIADESERFDAVVIIRGGGATTDLSCFDDYELCSFCAQFPLPILSGIGHHRDVSVVDMVVHTALKTPTAVAAFITDMFSSQEDILRELTLRLQMSAAKRVAAQQRQIEQVSARILSLLQQYVEREKYHLQNAQNTIHILSPEQIYKKGYSLATVNGALIRSIKDLQSGDVLQTEFADGKVMSVVQ